MKILAIDDSATMRILISKNLEELGFNDVMLCESGELALKILEKFTFDLVLLDWHMPGVNGLDILRFIRSRKYKETPVIMLTSEQQKDKIMLAINNGASDYIIKPLNKNRLKEKIDKLITHKT